MKCMGVVMALAIVAWVTVPAGADDNPARFWTFASSWDEGLILGENFDSLNLGDEVSSGSLSEDYVGGDTFLINNDNPDLTGNLFDGDSNPDRDISPALSFDNSPADHGAPTSGAYFIEGTVDNISNNFAMGVWNSSRNTQYNITYDETMGGWGWGFGPNGAAWSAADTFDPANPHRAITAVNVETGFAASYSFLAVDLKTGASWGHGGETGVPNHIPGFSTPTLRVFYDRRPNHARGNPMNSDMDDFRIATSPWIPVIPEPATFALLGLGGLLMLRRRV